MTVEERRRRIEVPPVVWWLLAALGIVLIAGLAYGIKHFDDDLTDRARVALRDAGIPVDVHLDGRDAYLTGSLEYETDAEQARSVVREVRGVRRVTSEVAFLVAGAPERPEVTPTVAPTTSPELIVRTQDGAILLRGTVASQAEVDDIVAAASQAFGADHVVNELQVDGTLDSPAWVGRVPAFMDSLVDLSSGSVAFGGQGASASGSVASDATKSTIGAALETTMAPLVVSNSIQVVTPTDPTLMAHGAGGTVVLRGELPDQASIDQVVVAAEGAYGAGNVTDEMTIAAGAATPDWLDAAPRMFDYTTGLDPWNLQIEDGILTVTGRGPADGTVPAAIASFGEIAAMGLTVETSGLEVAADAVATQLTDLLEGATTFETGSATLSAEATALLDQAIELLIANPSTTLTVEGHTDSQGDSGSNLALSQARADSVVAYLVAGGVAEDRLTSVGYGEEQPIASNDTAEGRSQNRRIEFIVEEGTG